MLMAENFIKTFVKNENEVQHNEPERILQSVTELLDELITQSVKLIGKPVALMSKDDKVKCIKFLNDSGAFPLSQSQETKSCPILWYIQVYLYTVIWI